MDKVKDIFKGKGQDAEKTQAFTGQTGKKIFLLHDLVLGLTQH